MERGQQGEGQKEGGGWKVGGATPFLLPPSFHWLGSSYRRLTTAKDVDEQSDPKTSSINQEPKISNHGHN